MAEAPQLNKGMKLRLDQLGLVYCYHQPIDINGQLYHYDSWLDGGYRSSTGLGGKLDTFTLGQLLLGLLNLFIGKLHQWIMGQ